MDYENAMEWAIQLYSDEDNAYSTLYRGIAVSNNKTKKRNAMPSTRLRIGDEANEKR